MSITVSQPEALTQKVFTFKQLKSGVLYKINGCYPEDYNRFDKYQEVYTKINNELVWFAQGKMNIQTDRNPEDRFIEAPKGTTVTLTND